MRMIIEFLSILYYRFFGSKKIRTYEKACLEAWTQKLSKDALAIVEQQVNLFNLIGRQSYDKLVIFWYIKDFSYQNLPEKFLFPLKYEAVVAKVWFRTNDKKTGSKYSAEITFYQGRIFSIEFSKPPKNIFINPKDKNNKLEIIDVIVLLDPMVANPYATETLNNISLTGWLSDWNQKWGLENLKQPLSNSKRNHLLKQYDSAFPEDYLELVAQTEGLKVKHCDIHGLSKIRSIVRPDDNYYILANKRERRYRSDSR